MIVANLATYPAREKHLIGVVKAIAPQVDMLNIVLNEYKNVPVELKSFPNVNPIIPPEDLKDVGKFYLNMSGAKYVLLIDDDIVFPEDFVEQTVSKFVALGDRRAIASYHGSIYKRPIFSRSIDNAGSKKSRSGSRRKIRRYLRRIVDYPRELLTYKTRFADFREVFVFFKAQKYPVIVDQVGSGVAILRAEDFPPYEYMMGSQKFVDVRLARWAYEHGLTCVTLPREKGWLHPIRFEDSIFTEFTGKNPEHVNQEIEVFAGKVPDAGEVLI